MNEFKLARQTAGLTQAKITELFGIPRRTVQDWEAEKKTPPVYVQRWYLEALAKIKK